MNELSIIVPVITKYKDIYSFIDNLVEYLKSNPGDIEVIIIVDETVKNPDAIVVFVKEKYPWLKLQVLQRFGKGSIRNYGALIRYGLAYSTSKYAVLVSSHGLDDISILPEMLKKIRKGYQIVQATRYFDGAPNGNVNLKYRIYRKIFNFILLTLAGIKTVDSTYSFKMFDRLFIQALGITRNRFSICPEITIKGLMAGGKVMYIPSKVDSIRDVHEFNLFKEGLGYVLIGLRAFGHRIGLLWF